MQTRYGSSPQDWERAKEEMRGVLVETAHRKEFITYSELVARVHTIRLDPHSHALAAMLGEISTEEHNRGRGMLSALVLSKDEMKPGTGFFALAEELTPVPIDPSPGIDRGEFWLVGCKHRRQLGPKAARTAQISGRRQADG